MKEEQRHRITKAKAPCALLIYFETALGATSFLIGVHAQPVTLRLVFLMFGRKDPCAVPQPYSSSFPTSASKAKSSGAEV